MSEVKRYECNGSSSVFECENGSLVDYVDYAALEAKCAALAAELKQIRIDADCYKKGMEASNSRLVQLAAENAALKAAHPQPFGHEMMKALDAYEKHQDEVPETGMLDAFFILRDSIRAETQATDAFLDEVLAQGVEMFAQWCRGERDFTLIDEDVADAAAYEECVKRAEYFAAQLRKGVDQK